MRAGWIVSTIGHVGAVIITAIGWRAHTEEVASQGVVIPVEVVDVSDVTNARALAPPEQEEEVPAPAAATPPQGAQAPAPAPREAGEDVDLAAWSRDLMKNEDARPTTPPGHGAPSDRLQNPTGDSTQDTARLEDRIRALIKAHMRHCWRAPVDLPDPERLDVVVQFDLGRDGTLRGQPRVVIPTNYSFDPPLRTAVDNALRAVRMCEPYPLQDDPVVAEHYDLWRNMEYRFTVKDS